MKLERKTFKAETKVFQGSTRERRGGCVSLERKLAANYRGGETGQSVYIIPIAKVLISHFRYNERLAGLKLRQTYLTWPISWHFPGKIVERYGRVENQSSFFSNFNSAIVETRFARFFFSFFVFSFFFFSRNEYGARISLSSPLLSPIFDRPLILFERIDRIGH